MILVGAKSRFFAEGLRFFNHTSTNNGQEQAI